MDTSVVGLPTDLLFSVIGGFGIYIFMDHKKQTRERFEHIEKNIEKINDSSKELSREEFEEVKGYVKESINTVINSREFRDDLKRSIQEILMHLDSNRSKGEAAMFEQFANLLESKLNQIVKAAQ